MTSTIGVYDTHEKALEGVDWLQKAGISEKQISIAGKLELVDDHLHIKHNEDINIAPLSIGVAAGTTLGLLTGVGLFAIPGLGFLFGAGAIVGAVAGVEFGAIGGVLVTALSKLGAHKDHLVKYEEHVKSGRFLVVIQGTEEELSRAKMTLADHGAQMVDEVAH